MNRNQLMNFCGCLLLAALSQDPIVAIAADPRFPPTIDVLTMGAKGDCVTDDAPAINAAIVKIEKSAAHSGQIFFRAPPGGCYRVDSPLVLSGQNPYVNESNYSHVSLLGEGRGVSVIRAGRPMDAVLEKDDIWNRGHTVTDLTLDANGLADHAVRWRRGSEGRFTRIEGLNALVADVRLEDHENFFSDSYFSNDATFPDYNILLAADPAQSGVYPTDNEFTNNILRNARIANIREGSAANHWVSNHGYNFGAAIPAPRYNFIANGGLWLLNQADGSQESGFLVLSPLGILSGNFVQKAQKHGICIAPETGGQRIVVANRILFAGSTPAASDAIVQGAWAGSNVSCEGSHANPGLGTQDVILGNSPNPRENLWNRLFIGPESSNGSGGGLIGIGTATPQAQLDVNGEIRIGSVSTVCDAERAGTLRFDGVSRQFLGCNGTTWVTLSNP